MKDVNSLNRVFLIGHLGGEPEIRYISQTERPVARFSLATNEVYFDQVTNENKRRTEWHRIVAWGKLAEFCEKYLTKGKQIYIEGKLRTRTWEDKSGIKRSTTEVEAQSIILLGRKEETVEVGSSEEVEVDNIEENPPEDEEVPF